MRCMVYEGSESETFVHNQCMYMYGSVGVSLCVCTLYSLQCWCVCSNVRVWLYLTYQKATKRKYRFLTVAFEKMKTSRKKSFSLLRGKAFTLLSNGNGFF